MKEIEEKLKELIKILNSEYNIEAIVLFGSYARNTQNKESDIDIAIKSDEDILKNVIEFRLEDLKEFARMMIKLERIV